MAKKSSVTIGKPIFSGGGGLPTMEIEYTGGRFAGKVESVRKEKALLLIKSGKAKRHDKEKGNIQNKGTD